MRSLCVSAALALVTMPAGCATTEQKVAQESVADGSVLRLLNLSQVEVKYQASCVVAVKQASRARPLACVYVQTTKSLYFLRYNSMESKYVPTVSVDIGELTSVALARSAINRQIQINRKGEVLAFQIDGGTFVNTAMTENIFASLKAAGVPAKEPEKWIELIDPVPMTITIPVYVGG
jgi:hypothetical protein